MSSNLKPCKTCGNEIASSAKTCPYCGAKNKKPIILRWWFVVLAFFILFGIIGAAVDGNANTTTSNMTTTSANTSTSNKTPSATDPTTAVPTTIDLSTVEKEYVLKAGHYTAGIDLPIGKCDVKAVSGTGNLSSSNMYAGGVNEMFGVGGGMYTSEFSGLKMTKDVALNISSELEIKLTYTKIEGNFSGRTYDEANKIPLKSGNYVAGEDFPSGVYKIVAVSGTGNLSSSNMYAGGLNEMFGVGGGMYTGEFKNVVLSDTVELNVKGGLKIELIPAIVN